MAFSVSSERHRDKQSVESQVEITPQIRVFEPNVLTTTLQRLSLGCQVQSYQERRRTTATREDNLQDTFEDSPYLFSIKRRRMILHTGRTLHRYHAWVMQEVQYKGCLVLSLTDVSVVSSLC